ncbi:GNAT family N-acetyltransferase [Dyadobacter sp. CY261]|uniref:GNAT family N-acetyltransferase n=1 Tax=Dyadobacter sp. CY261 TaxID=2907203 RepID=UPI001F484F60|nr:GNAT family N-acetyltransferase [Dyadobacter sp. CY261]MCF0069342.1 GNAT family N-acetyltransferase [Dyadobacter sp. CY261]
MAVSYLLEVDEDIVGFFCVSNDRICKGDTDKWRKIKDSVPYPKRRNSYPAVKIGRLAIDKKFQRGGFGNRMLEYIKYLFLKNNKTGCRFLLVDAYLQSVNFYSKNGFVELSNDKSDKDTKLMYFDLNYFRPSIPS